MSFIQRILSWLTPESAPPAPAVSPLAGAPGLVLATAPSLEIQRYSDANYAVSRALEARKMAVMARICEVNNAAAEDVIDRKGTIRQAMGMLPHGTVIPMSAQELDDAINLADVVFATEKSHDPRQ